ncbi:hypothetical protein ACFV8E_21625 [Streptomyces sp. NPDC059849]|uniref:hypothetical protein n=1 Tax=Streptomyces sp. NPDC059849 TaxID=3346969 RepID=UPI00365D98EE
MTRETAHRGPDTAPAAVAAAPDRSGGPLPEGHDPAALEQLAAGVRGVASDA